MTFKEFKKEINKQRKAKIGWYTFVRYPRYACPIILGRGNVNKLTSGGGFKMKFNVDVKLTGYEQVTVEEAYEKAQERFWEIYDKEPAQSLRWKSTTSTILEDG